MVFSGSWGTWVPLWMCGRGLLGSTVGLVGLGRIGASVARKIRPFQPTSLLYHTPEPKPQRWPLISCWMDGWMEM